MSWKSDRDSGGGVVRFYGIQILALLAELGYSSVLSSEMVVDRAGEPYRWLATFSGKGLPACGVVIDSKASEENFCVEYENKGRHTLVRQLDPFEFEGTVCSGLDRRVSILEELCLSVRDDSNYDYCWYRDLIILWQKVEAATSDTQSVEFQ